MVEVKAAEEKKRRQARMSVGRVKPGMIRSSLEMP
jgi:hypothetical protein